MPVNRRTRDQLLIEALDMADLPELDQHDRPSATIVSTAFSINWLQRCLDTIAHEFPWASEVTQKTGTLSALNTDTALTDFILDVRNGLFLTINGTLRQLIRRNFSDIVLYQARHDQGGSPMTGQPSLYAFTGATVRLDITPDQSYAYTLWYYALPSVLTASTIPAFPSDHCMIDFVYWRAMEWARKVPPGSAMKYLRETEIAAMRAAGLGQEPESDYIPLDEMRFRGRRQPWGSGWDVRA